MNKTDISQIDRIFYPGWLMVSQLRSGQVIGDGDSLYRQARRLVEDARTALKETVYPQSQQDLMVYALCALLDESVLNRGTVDDGYLIWRRDPLQAYFFSTLNAGEDLWDQIRLQLKQAEPDMAVLTCLYRTVQLGFVGQYRNHGDEQREELVGKLRERAAPFQLAEETAIVSQAFPLRRGRRLYWLCWAAGGIVLIGLWVFLSSSLTEMVNQIISPE